MAIHLENPFPCVFVRPAQPSDDDDLQRMCWPNRSLDSVRDHLERTQIMAFYRQGLSVVALRDGVLCGFGLLTVWPNAAEISDLIVNTRYRGQGIGSLMITYLTQIARNLRVKTLEIGVRLSNVRALALYRRLGFVDDRVVDLDLGNGPEKILYLIKTL
jgi:ribosomal protein S18 acetylase RimI-like enzyme